MTLSCVDGPYPVANPNDPRMSLEMRLVGGVDTVRTPGQVVVFQLVTTPAVTGYEVLWLTSDAAWLAPVGDGRYVNRVLPPSPVTILVSAKLGTREASRTVIIVPGPP